MVETEIYKLEELLDKPLVLIDARGTAPGSNIFAWRGNMTKKVSRGLALKKKRFVSEYLVALLNKYKKDGYHFNKDHLQTVRKCRDWGINMEYVRRCKAKSITRICFTAKGIQSAFKQFYGRGRLNDYNEENLEQELRSSIY